MVRQAKNKKAAAAASLRVQHVPNGTHLLGFHLHVFLDLRSVIVHQLLALINRRICHGVLLPDTVQRASFRVQEWTVALRPWTASMLEIMSTFEETTDDDSL
jgi:hypothetical protein